MTASPCGLLYSVVNMRQFVGFAASLHSTSGPMGGLSGQKIREKTCLWGAPEVDWRSHRIHACQRRILVYLIYVPTLAHISSDTISFIMLIKFTYHVFSVCTLVRRTPHLPTHRWACLLKQHSQITIYRCRLPTKENNPRCSISVCRKQTANFPLFVIYMLPFQTENGKMEALAIFLSPFAVCSLCKRKFVVTLSCWRNKPKLAVYKQAKGTCPSIYTVHI